MPLTLQTRLTLDLMLTKKIRSNISSTKFVQDELWPLLIQIDAVIYQLQSHSLMFCAPTLHSQGCCDEDRSQEIPGYTLVLRGVLPVQGSDAQGAVGQQGHSVIAQHGLALAGPADGRGGLSPGLAVQHCCGTSFQHSPHWFNSDNWGAWKRKGSHGHRLDWFSIKASTEKS